MQVGKVVYKINFTVRELSGGGGQGMGIERTTATIAVNVTKCTTVLSDDDDDSFENNAADEDIDNGAGAMKVVREKSVVDMECSVNDLATVDPMIIYECHDSERMPERFSDLLVRTLRRQPSATCRSFAVLCKQINELFKVQTVAVGKKSGTAIKSFDDLVHLGTVQLIAIGNIIVRWSFLPEAAYAFWPRVKMCDLEHTGPYPLLPNRLTRTKTLEMVLFAMNSDIFGNPVHSARVFGLHEQRWLVYRESLLKRWEWTAENTDASVDWRYNDNPWVDLGDGRAMSEMLHTTMNELITACDNLAAVSFIGTPRDFYEFVHDNLEGEADRMVYIVADASDEYYPPFRDDLATVTLTMVANAPKEPDSAFVRRVCESAGIVLLDMHAMDNGKVRDLLLLINGWKNERNLPPRFRVFMCGLYVTAGSMSVIHHLYSLHNPRRTISVQDKLYTQIAGESSSNSNNNKIMSCGHSVRVCLQIYDSRAVLDGVVRKIESDVQQTRATNQQVLLPLVLFSSASLDSDIEAFYPANDFLALRPGFLAFRRRDGAVVSLLSVGLQVYDYVQPLSSFFPDKDKNLAHMARYSIKGGDRPMGLMEDEIEPLRPFRVGSRFMQPFSHIIFINPSEFISPVDISILQSVSCGKLVILTLGTKPTTVEHANLKELLSLTVIKDSNDDDDGDDN